MKRLPYHLIEFILKYLSVKAFAVTSIHITKDKFCFVPMPDCSQTWNDKKLYAKYNLNQEEMDYIENMIKSMDGGDE